MLERNAKRRRMKYKTKSVHTSRKTTTEITREVINGQMEAYEDWLQQELNLETSSTSTSVKQAPASPQSSSKLSYDEEHSNGLSHTHRSLSKESTQSKYQDKYNKHENNTPNHEESPKAEKKSHNEYHSPKHYEYRRERNDAENFRRERSVTDSYGGRPRENYSERHYDEYRSEKYKYKTYKKEYYDEKYHRKVNEYEDRYKSGRSRDRYKSREYRYQNEYDRERYDDRYDRKSDCSVSVKDENQ